jgi:hypothetical protein
MKLENLKIGDKINCYQLGELIEAEVIEILPNGVKTKHKPMQWGKETYTTCHVLKSLSLHYQISQTTPSAFTLNGVKITA